MSQKRENREILLDWGGRRLLRLMYLRAGGEELAQWLRVPLRHGCLVADFDLVDELLKAGADGSNRGPCGNERPLLHVAVHGGSARIVRRLLTTAAALPGIDDKAEGRTALQVAVGNGNQEAAKVLIKAGADVGGALDIAIQEGHEMIALDLLNAGADPNGGGKVEPLVLACQEGYVSTVKALLERGAAMDVFNVHGEAPLHYAVKSRASDAVAVIEALLAAGADVNAQDNSEPCGALKSPLHIAARKGHYEAAHALLRHGADVYAKYVPSGWHPVHFACKKLHEDLVELLLRWEADEAILGRYGETASDCVPSEEKIRGGQDVEIRLAKRDRILKLLAHAPNDRAWRRRGFVVLCRAHPGRLRLACGKDPRAGGGASASDSDSDSASDSDGHPGSWGNKMARQELAGARGEENIGDGAVGSFDRLAAWLVHLQDDNLFRQIVGFL
eukprot:g9459.t1